MEQQVLESNTPENNSQNLSAQSQSTFQNAALQLRNNKQHVKKLWEKRVREQVAEAQGKTSLILVNSLEKFLDKLTAKIGHGDASEEIGTESGMSKDHGGQRATFRGYFLPQLLIEFSILRQVLNEELQNKGVLTFEVRELIDKIIDSNISKAATEFVVVQNSQVAEALKRAEASNLDLEHFAAVAAHDLKSPLSTISSYTEYLTDKLSKNLETQDKDFFESIQKTASRMSRLIDRLLEYSQLTRTERPFQSVDANECVNAAIQNLKVPIEQTHAQVIFKNLPRIQGDPELIIQIFQNLIANALKFHSEQSPKVEITAKEDEASWTFAIRDNGIGFDPKHKEDIFALYKKLHANDQYKGFGIGLATTRKLVELHGGQIWAESQPRHGSTFYFRLPKERTERIVFH